MSNWKVVVPHGTTNKALNPSAETTGNYAAVNNSGTTTVSRSTTYQKYGVYSYLVTVGLAVAGGDGLNLTLSALINAIHYVSFFVRGTNIGNLRVSLNGATFHTPTLLLTLDANWYLYGVQIPAAQANGSTALLLYCTAGVGMTVYVDAVQVEADTTWTTYIDGDQPGGRWAGVAHGSVSARSAVDRRGGYVKDLNTDYLFGVVEEIGWGATQQALTVDEYALLPGGELNSARRKPRACSLVGILRGTGADCDLHQSRQALLNVLSPFAYPSGADGIQAARLWYCGADVVKEIGVHYEGGLEAERQLENRIHEKVALRFIADDPNFYEIGETAVTLDSSDQLASRYICARLRSTGQWDDLGLTNDPTANGTIYAMVYNPKDGRVYVGGDFTGMNNVAGRDYLAAYDPAMDTWYTVGAGSGVNNVVWAIAIAPNGDVYFGGDFTNVGDANGDYLAMYDLSAGALASVAGGGTGPVYALAFGPDGTLYIGGDFDSWNGDADNRNVTKLPWGGAYTPMDKGLSGIGAVVNSVVVSRDGTVVFAGGTFTEDGNGITMLRVSQWAGTAWNSMGGGLNSTVYALAVSPDDGTLYLGGLFTDAGGNANADYVAGWSGTGYFNLGSGPGRAVWSLALGPDGILFAGCASGPFSFGLGDGFMKWRGGEWAFCDCVLLGGPTVTSILTCNQDPIVPTNYDVYIGLSASSTISEMAGTATLSNAGTAEAHPRLIFVGGGTGFSAIMTSVRNETTGKELNLYWKLLNGETVTIVTDPVTKGVVSDFGGEILSAVLAGSDFGLFILRPGPESSDNQITCFAARNSFPVLDVASYAVWRTAYDGYD